METDPDRAPPLLPAPQDALDRLGLGMLVTTPDGLVIEANETATRLVTEAFGAWPEGATCCSLFGCRSHEPLALHCISELASSTDGSLPELRVDLPPELPTNAVWVTAARTEGEGSPVLLHLRPAVLGDRRQRTEPHWMAGPRLRVQALGRTRITTEETSIEGQWLMQRPGELLKYLVCQRGRPTHVDEIAEALWPNGGMSGRSTVRYYVHNLRDLLEPLREPRGSSSFIVSVQGSYALDPRVNVDLDEFESLAMAGLRSAGAESETGPEASSLLAQAMDLYRGDLFEEEPFAAWAFAERERLRSLALRSLSALVERRRSTDPALALDYLERFSDRWPVDTSLQRSLIDLYLQQGRRSDAQRRYAAFRKRLREEFEEEPGFELADLGPGRVPESR